MAALVIRAGTTSVDALADSFDVSPMTLYRDLAALESRHVLTRSRGEVTAIASSLSETPVEFRREQEVEEKNRIGRAVAAQIDFATSIFIDDSTTGAHCLPHLKSTHQKTLMTNSVSIANTIASDLSYKELVVIGGSYDPTLDAMFGPAAESQMSMFAPEVAVFGAAAVDESGVFHPYSDAASFKRKLLPRVSMNILAVTASKLTRTALYRISDLKAFAAIVIDSAAPTAVVQKLNKHTQVIIA